MGKSKKVGEVINDADAIEASSASRSNCLQFVLVLERLPVTKESKKRLQFPAGSVFFTSAQANNSIVD